MAVALSSARFAASMVSPGISLLFECACSSCSPETRTLARWLLLFCSPRAIASSIFPSFRHSATAGVKTRDCLRACAIGDPPFDHDADRVGRHDAENHDDAFGDSAHRTPKFYYVDLSHRISSNLRLSLANYLRLKMTVTVAITGTGSPLSKVGEYFHCFTARTASSSSSG